MTMSDAELLMMDMQAAPGVFDDDDGPDPVLMEVIETARMEFEAFGAGARSLLVQRSARSDGATLLGKLRRLAGIADAIGGMDGGRDVAMRPEPRRPPPMTGELEDDLSEGIAA